MEHLQENIRTYTPLKPVGEQEYIALEKVTEIMLMPIMCNVPNVSIVCPVPTALIYRAFSDITTVSLAQAKN